MKKVLGLVGCCIGFLLLILGSVMKMKEHTTVCIIGGADGPTSIFLAEIWAVIYLFLLF